MRSRRLTNVIKCAVLLCCFAYTTVECDNHLLISVHASSLKKLELSQTLVVRVNITCNSTDPISNRHSVRFIVKDESRAKIKGRSTILVNCNQTQENIVVVSEQIGETSLDVIVINNKHDATQYSSYPVIVRQVDSVLDYIFLLGIILFVFILTFGFGCRIHVDVVKAILRRPSAPALGLCCQIIVMPLLGITLTHALSMDKLFGFGLFVVSCCPGGGASNVWTVLLDGDLDLSMTLTFCSKTLALGTMPLWLFAAGRLYGDVGVEVPYANLVAGLAGLVIPCMAGVYLRRKRPAWADIVSKMVKGLSLLFITWLVIVGTITKFFVFWLMISRWYILPGAMLLPFVGSMLGCVIACIFKQPRNRVVAIAVETGVQDSGVAILLLLTSFGAPAGQIASVVPIASSMFTPLPFALVLICKTIYEKCWLGGKCIGGPSKPDDVEYDVSNCNTTKEESKETQKAFLSSETTNAL